MRITVVAHPKSHEEKVEKLDERYYEVFFNVAPEKGKANKKIIELLADYFDVPKSSVHFFSGEKSKLKIFDVEQ